MIQAQGGDPRVIEDPARLPSPRRQVVLTATTAGTVQRLAARPVGQATMLLGAGRARMDSPVDHAVGVVVHKKVGDPVAIGEPLCTLFVNDESRLEDARALIRDAYTIGPEPATPGPLILERIMTPLSRSSS